MNAYVTWDATYFSYGLANGNADYDNMATFMYFGMKNTEGQPLSGPGTTNGYCWGSNITLPFKCDTIVVWKNQGGAEWIEVFYWNGAWTSYGSASATSLNGDEVNFSIGADFREARIKRSKILGNSDTCFFATITEEQWGANWRYMASPSDGWIDGNRAGDDSFAKSFLCFILKDGVSPVARDTEIVLTEIQATASGDNEWVEIYNTGNGSKNLAGWYIGDAAGEDALGTCNGNGRWLGAKMYALIIDQDAILNYSALTVSGNGPILNPGTTLASAGLLNGNANKNANDTVQLRTATGAANRIDQRNYMGGAASNRSDERLVYAQDLMDSETSNLNWQYNKNSDSTPWAHNSNRVTWIDVTWAPASAAPSESFNVRIRPSTQNGGDTPSNFAQRIQLTIDAGSVAPTYVDTQKFTSGVAVCSVAVYGTTGSRIVTLKNVLDSSIIDSFTINIASDVDSPSYRIMTAANQWYSSNPSLDVNCTDDVNIDSIGYRMSTYTGYWKGITSDGSTYNGYNISGTSFTTDFKIQTADWNAVGLGTPDTIWFMVRDDAGKETGTGGVTATGLTIRKDTVVPTITVNRDTYTLKSDGGKYGRLFNVDFYDSYSGIDSVWVTNSSGGDTATVFYKTCTTTYDTEWAIPNAFTAALGSGNNIVKVRCQDTAGNVATAGTIYLDKEVINATNGDTSDWQTDELLDVRKGNYYYMSWDDSSLYIAYAGSDVNLDGDVDFFVYFQLPGFTESTRTSINWSGQGTHSLPIEMTHVICFELGSMIQVNKYSAGSWDPPLVVPDSDAYGAWAGNKITEYRISWSHLGGKPAWMKAMMFHQYDGFSTVFNSYPQDNPAPLTGNVPFTAYYYWPLIADTVPPNTCLKVTIESGVRVMDGDSVDWTSNLPTSDDTSLIKDSEYIWRAALLDQRNDLDDFNDTNFDIRAFRITGDTGKLYFLSEFNFMDNTAAPILAIAIDTMPGTALGQTAIGGYSQTNTTADAAWNMNILACLTKTGWWDAAFTPPFRYEGVSFLNSYYDNFEIAMPWSELNCTPPVKLRFSVIVGQNNAGDFKCAGAWDPVTMSRSLDGITTAGRKAAGGGGWYGEFSAPDQELGYYFDVNFDSRGSVIYNKYRILSYPTETSTYDTFRVSIQTVDFNGCTVTQHNAGNVGISHNGGGVLTLVDSTPWNNGQKYLDLKYSRAETVTITLTDSTYGQTGSFTTHFSAFPDLRITEVGVNATISDPDSDFIEVYCASDRGDSLGANLTGYELMINATSRYTFPAVWMRSGSLMVLSFAAGTNDLTDTGDSLVVLYMSPALEGAGGLPTATDRSIWLKPRGFDMAQAPDAMIYNDNDAAWDLAATGTAATNLTAAGKWSSTDATGAVQYPATSYLNMGMHRDTPYVDSDSNIDWIQDTISRGTFPLHHFTITSDSANPVEGESFTLTIRAIDYRGKTCSSHQGNAILSVSAGSITKTWCQFKRTLNGETQITVALNGGGGAVTITASETTGFGVATGSLTVNVQATAHHFDLTCTDPNLLTLSRTVRRNFPFNLKIAAKSAAGAIVTSFNDTVTIKANFGTLSIDSVPFKASWNGETVIPVIISDSRAVGLDTITCTSGVKTGYTTVAPLSDNRLVINEVLPVDLVLGANDRDEWVEIYNRSLENVSTAGWLITDYDASGEFSLPTVTIPSGSRLIIHYNEIGANDLGFGDTDYAAHVFPASSENNSLSDQDEIGLYSSTTMDSLNIASYVSWASGASWIAQSDTHALQAGIWVNNQTFSHGAATATILQSRALFRQSDGRDTYAGASASDWEVQSAVDTFVMTEGYSNAIFDTGLTGVSILLRSYTLSTETVAIGESLIITLKATGGGNNSTRGVTTVRVYSNADTTGIIVSLFETDTTADQYTQDVVIVNKAESSSKDGHRLCAASTSDSIYVKWIKGDSETISSVAGPLHHFNLAAPTNVSNDFAFSMTIAAKNSSGGTKEDYTGSVNLTISSGSIAPTSVNFVTTDSGDVVATITITGAALGAVTITATEATTGETGSATVNVVGAPAIVINEVMCEPAAVDWDGDAGADVNRDEWVELYNRTNVDTSIANWKVGADGVSKVTLLGTIPARGYAVIYRRGAGSAEVFFFDSRSIQTGESTSTAGALGPLNNDGVRVYLLSSSGDTIDDVTTANMDAYPDSSYARSWDGGGVFKYPVRSTPGWTPADPAENSDSNANMRFRIAMPDSAPVGTARTLYVVAVDARNDTVTNFTQSGVLITESGAPDIDLTTLSFTNGICSTLITFTNATGTSTLTVTHDTTSVGRKEVYVTQSAVMSITKSLRTVTLGGNPSNAIPGATAEYELSYSNIGTSATETAIIYDSIPLNSQLAEASRQTGDLGASATFNDTFAVSGWVFQYSTVAVPDQNDTSPNYSSGWPADLSTVRWIRWKKSTVPGSSSATIRFRVYLL